MEFRKMRRFRQQLTQSECDAILSIGTSGTLALLGDNGYPYAVPLSYVYADDKLYFHSAKTGHKVDAIRQYNKASFCVIAADDIHPSEFTTYFRSVIAFGKIQIIESEDERMYAASLLGARYNPGDDAGLHKELEKGLSHMLILRLDIEHMTGKEAIELVRKKWHICFQRAEWVRQGIIIYHYKTAPWTLGEPIEVQKRENERENEPWNTDLYLSARDF